MGISEDLDQLNASIQKLQVAWDKYFGGAERKPPVELAAKVDALVKKYAYAELRNNMERFRYQSLTSRYNALNELWNKKMRAREEGHAFGLHGRTLAHAEEITAAPHEAPRVPSPEIPRVREVRIARPDADRGSVRELYDQFMAARAAAGESAVVKMESFEKLIQQQTTRILSSKSAQAVDFRVETRDGKVTLKAKPVT